MVCPQCGTLNPDKREACFRCDHSLSRAKFAEEGRCHWHPHVASDANCTVCNLPLCRACAIRVEDVSYCPNCAAVPGENRPGEPNDLALTALEMETAVFASAGWRLASGVIDAFFIGAGAIILAMMFWLFAGAPPGMPWMGGVNFLYWFIVFVGTGAYIVGYLAVSGQTPGYGATDLMLVRRDGRQVKVPEAILRFLVSFISAGFFMLGYLWMLWDPLKQTWHDKAADSVVIRTSERKELPADVEPPGTRSPA